MRIDEMVKMPLSNVDSWILVLAIINKLSRGGRPTVDATTDGIQRDLKKIYDKDLTKRDIEYILQDLQNRGLIFKEKGLLRDGRAVLYGITSSKTTQEAFNLIKIDPQRAYIHDGYEGLVYDPPSTEVALRETDNTGNLRVCHRDDQAHVAAGAQKSAKWRRLSGEEIAGLGLLLYRASLKKEK